MRKDRADQKPTRHKRERKRQRWRHRETVRDRDKDTEKEAVRKINREGNVQPAHLDVGGYLGRNVASNKEGIEKVLERASKKNYSGHLLLRNASSSPSRSPMTVTFSLAAAAPSAGALPGCKGSLNCEPSCAPVQAGHPELTLVYLLQGCPPRRR